MLYNTFAEIYVYSYNHISFYISSTFEITQIIRINYYYYKMIPNIKQHPCRTRSRSVIHYNIINIADIICMRYKNIVAIQI